MLSTRKAPWLRSNGMSLPIIADVISLCAPISSLLTHQASHQTHQWHRNIARIVNIRRTSIMSTLCPVLLQRGGRSTHGGWRLHIEMAHLMIWRRGPSQVCGSYARHVRLLSGDKVEALKYRNDVAPTRTSETSMRCSRAARENKSARRKSSMYQSALQHVRNSNNLI